MGEYKPTIGLEIHAELKTQTKMFCSSINDPEEKQANVNICPVCMAHPGTLPVINKKAVKHVLKVGMTINGNLADFTEFDRKNYFYPDIPKGYQISQYKYPLISGGSLAGVDITRIHLEEDTARSTHHDGPARPDGRSGGYSLVDFNRAGLPLMELVTEPVVKNAEQASMFAKELQLLLRTLGVSDANMEKGEMRVEANISVSKTDTFGTKVEVKNLNSFKIVEKAIDYEIKRQIELIESGGEVSQETRGWDENKQETFSQRAKEGSADYRYFPDPDLPKLCISEIDEFSKESLKTEIPELPWEKRRRYKKEYEIKDEDIAVFVTDKNLGDFFEKTVMHLRERSVLEEQLRELIKLASNYITSDLVGVMKGGEKMNLPNPKKFAKLITMAKEGDISSRATKDILAIFYREGGDPEAIAKEKNLLQKSDEGELKKIVKIIIEENKDVTLEFQKGKESALQFLIGQGMKATKGSGNPKILSKIFIEELKN